MYTAYLAVVYYLYGATGDWDVIVHQQTAAVTDPVMNSHDRLVVLCRYTVLTHDAWPTAVIQGRNENHIIKGQHKPPSHKTKFNKTRPIASQCSNNFFVFCLTHPVVNKCSTNTSQWQGQPKFIKKYPITSQFKKTQPITSQFNNKNSQWQAKARFTVYKIILLKPKQT